MDYPPLEAIANLIEERYLFADRAVQIAQTLRATQFDAPNEILLAEQITASLIEMSHDKHFFLRYQPQTGLDDHDSVMRAHGEQARLRNYGFQTMAWLQGNIGYWHLTELAPPMVISDLIEGAFSFFANVHALVIDLAGNRGGMAETVQLMASQFVEAGRDLSGIAFRDQPLSEAKTLPDMQRFLQLPLFILIDGETFSAGEALAYDLQALKRATILGQTSKGGAHLSAFEPFGSKWVLRIPIARAFNPITQNNWEGTGVIPDIVTPHAKQDAHQLALEHLINSFPGSSHHMLWKTALDDLRA